MRHAAAWARLGALAGALAMAAAPAWAALDTSGAAPDPVRGTGALAMAFGETCLDHGESAAALRAALDAKGWALMKPEDAGVMLKMRPGAAYGAKYDDIRVMMDSLDVGGCSAVTDRADPPALAAAMEGQMTARGWKFFLALEEDGGDGGLLHIRRYHVLRGGEIWELIVATHPTAANRSFMAFSRLAPGYASPRDVELKP